MLLLPGGRTGLGRLAWLLGLGLGFGLRVSAVRHDDLLAGYEPHCLRFGTVNSVDVYTPLDKSFPGCPSRFVSRAGVSVDDLLKRFGERLRDVRRRKGLSQEKLAELAGVHRTFVSSVERGERNISLLNIARLAKALDTTLAKLMPP